MLKSVILISIVLACGNKGANESAHEIAFLTVFKKIEELCPMKVKNVRLHIFT